MARQVETAVSTALGRVRPELDGADPLVRRSDRADFQSNVALASAKRVKARPAELAAELAQALQGVDGIADVEVSGPGFLNITVGEAGLSAPGSAAAPADDRLGVERSEQGSRVVVDYSAAQHRQGDARRAPALDDHRRLARARARSPGCDRDPAEPPRRLGHPVRDADPVPRRAPGRAVAALRSCRRRGRVRRVDGLGAGPAVQGRPRAVRRRRGVRRPVAGPGRRAAGGRRGRRSRAGARSSTSPSSRSGEIYGRLGVLLEPGDSAGESFYNQWLAEVVDELLAAGVATLSDGAVRRQSRTSRRPTASRPC